MGHSLGHYGAFGLQSRGLSIEFFDQLLGQLRRPAFGPPIVDNFSRLPRHQGARLSWATSVPPVVYTLMASPWVVPVMRRVPLWRNLPYRTVSCTEIG